MVLLKIYHNNRFLFDLLPRSTNNNQCYFWWGKRSMEILLQARCFQLHVQYPGTPVPVHTVQQYRCAGNTGHGTDKTRRNEWFSKSLHVQNNFHQLSTPLDCFIPTYQRQGKNKPTNIKTHGTTTHTIGNPIANHRTTNPNQPKIQKCNV